MDIDRLRQSYLTNPELEAICNELGNRKNNQNVTKLLSFLTLLNKDRHEQIKQLKLIAAFRELEACECGEYIEGRHGHVSRFVWDPKFGSITICRAAMGDSSIDNPPSSMDELDQVVEGAYESDDDSEYPTRLNHSFKLRADYQFEITLPVDLTITESERLAAFIITLPLRDGAFRNDPEHAEEEHVSEADKVNPIVEKSKGNSIIGRAFRILNRRGKPQ